MKLNLRLPTTRLNPQNEKSEQNRVGRRPRNMTFGGTPCDRRLSYRAAVLWGRRLPYFYSRLLFHPNDLDFSPIDEGTNFAIWNVDSKFCSTCANRMERQKSIALYRQKFRERRCLRVPLQWLVRKTWWLIIRSSSGHSCEITASFLVKLSVQIRLNDFKCWVSFVERRMQARLLQICSSTRTSAVHYITFALCLQCAEVEDWMFLLLLRNNYFLLERNDSRSS